MADTAARKFFINISSPSGGDTAVDAEVTDFSDEPDGDSAEAIKLVNGDSVYSESTTPIRRLRLGAIIKITAGFYFEDLTAENPGTMKVQEGFNGQEYTYRDVIHVGTGRGASGGAAANRTINLLAKKVEPVSKKRRPTSTGPTS